MNWCLLKTILLTEIVLSGLKGCLGIIGGRITTREKYFVTIEGPVHVCGGTLIDSDIVVTAAECLYNLPLSQIDPWIFGHTYTRASRLEITRPSDGGQYTCERYSIHPRYPEWRDADSPLFNIAVLKLAQCVHLSLALAPCPNLPYHEGYAIGIGWRRRQRNGEYQMFPLEVKLQKDPQCRQFSGQTVQSSLPGIYKEFCFGTHVIADFAQTQTIPGLFVGDIGGPLVHKRVSTHEAECLIGIASTYLTSSDGSKITNVFTSAAEYHIYLGETIEQLHMSSRCEIMK